MCIQREPHNFSAPIYNKMGESLEAYFEGTFSPSLAKARQSGGLGKEFLREWVKRWRNARFAVSGMRRMFMYLDRFHVPNSEELLTTKEHGFALFRDSIFAHFKDDARKAILGFIARERDGESVDRELLKQSIAVFVEMGQCFPKTDLQFYREDFHKHLVTQASQHYSQTSSLWMEEMSAPHYLRRAEQCINEDKQRLTSYCHQASAEGLLKATRDALLKSHEDALLAKETGINQMLAAKSLLKDDLSRLYSLYADVKEGLGPVSEAMKAHVCSVGHSLVQKSKGETTAAAAAELVSSLIALHSKFHAEIVGECFQKDALFLKALKEAFEEFINKEYYVSAFLARFSNDLLKKTSSVRSLGEREATMSQIVMLYGYIRDKDIFERDYQLFLAARLLQNLSLSEASERSFIGKLKVVAGYNWASKLEEMFKDIQMSKELSAEFRESHSEDLPLFLEVSVCTMGAWPSSNACAKKAVNKPETVGKAADSFHRFYTQSKHKGRKLHFQMDKGKAECRVQFNEKTSKVLVVSSFQMLVLCLFNDAKTLTFKDIVDRTQIPREDAETALMSMVHPKVKVMRKRPNTRQCEDSHEFQVNPQFTHPRAKVVVPTYFKKNNAKTVPKGDPHIALLRKHQTDAAIVRVMKTRQTLSHPELLAEVVKQLRPRFLPKPLDVKKRVMNLIELDYLQRCPNKKGFYKYLA